MNASLPSLPTWASLTQVSAEPEPIYYEEAPRPEELPVGAAQVTFTMIPSGENYVILTHSVGIQNEDEFETFMDAAADDGGLPEFGN